MEWRPSGRHSFLWLHSSVLLRRCSLFRHYSSVLLCCCYLSWQPASALLRLGYLSWRYPSVLLRRPCALSQRSSPLRCVFLCSFRAYSILPSPSPIVIIRCSGRLRIVQLSFPPSLIVIIRCSGWLRIVQLSFALSSIIIIRCKWQLHMSLWSSLSLFRWFC